MVEELKKWKQNNKKWKITVAEEAGHQQQRPSCHPEAENDTLAVCNLKGRFFNEIHGY